jgi:predicted site-specific integrase-resolvase
MKAYLNASEIAKLLKVDRATVSRWLKKGLLHGAVRLESTHQWRVPLAAYENFVKNDKKQ